MMVHHEDTSLALATMMSPLGLKGLAMRTVSKLWLLELHILFLALLLRGHLFEGLNLCEQLLVCRLLQLRRTPAWRDASRLGQKGAIVEPHCRPTARSKVSQKQSKVSLSLSLPERPKNKQQSATTGRFPRAPRPEDDCAHNQHRAPNHAAHEHCHDVVARMLPAPPHFYLTWQPAH